MKSLMMLWRVAADELGGQCNVSTTRDFNTVTSRVEHEGLPFLAITLPTFGKDFQKSLAEGRVARNLFQGFSWQAGLPRFLGGFLELVFDRGTGVLLDNPSIGAIHAVRQLTMLFGKVEVPTSAKRDAKALRGFIECESEIKDSDRNRTLVETLEFQQVSNLLWGEVLWRIENDLREEYAGESRSLERDPHWPILIPRHGSGSTADRLRGNAKFDLVEWTQRLEDVFPYGEYVLPNWRSYDRLDRVDLREPGAERPVRVITVPKTLKTPRIIAIEPTCMQYMQQGLFLMLVDRIRGDRTMGKVVGFDDQWRNHRLVRRGSLDGSLASLDLSEASDRVSNQLVRAMLAHYPRFLAAVDATRSRRADVRGEVIRLAKFASMGSALTFPIEAMVFATCVFIGIQRCEGRRLRPKDIQSLRSQVRVYGDDIIVPTDYAQSVITTLEAYGFKVNRDKSFVTGRFRESCGKEYYNGEDVSLVRCRAVVVDRNGQYGLPTSRKSVLETESTVALRNRFYLSGMWQTAAWLDRWIAGLLGPHYPTLEVTRKEPWEVPAPRSNVLGRWSILPVRKIYSIQDRLEIDPDWHVPMVRAYQIQHQIPKSPVSGVGALVKVLRPGRQEPFEDPRHLEQAGRPQSSCMKLRKVPIL